jgi:hypothetical protein
MDVGYPEIGKHCFRMAVIRQVIREKRTTLRIVQHQISAQSSKAGTCHKYSSAIVRSAVLLEPPFVLQSLRA